MKRGLLTCVMSTVFLAACAGTDGPAPGTNGSTNSAETNNTTPNSTTPNSTTPNSTTPNSTTPNSTTPNSTTPNNATNNVTPNNSTNNATNNATNSSTNNSTNNSTPDEWVALVANGDFTADTSSWSVVRFDGTSATTTAPEPFGTGDLAVAAAGSRAYVVDLGTGMAVVLDSTTFQEVKRVDLETGAVDSAAAGNGLLLAASGDAREIALYSEASGGLQPSIPLGAFSSGGGLAMFANDVAADGTTVAGVVTESAQFPTTPTVFVADSSTSSIVDVDPNTAGDQGLGVSGASRLSSMGGERFAVATKTDGIVVLEEAGGNWTVDQTLMTAAQFGGAEIQGVVMASDTRGLALTYGDSFEAIVFDAVAGSVTTVDPIALPTSLVGADATADGTLYFVGDYGVRNEPDKPYGVAIVDASTGMVLDHVTTDDDIPPTDIVVID